MSPDDNRYRGAPPEEAGCETSSLCCKARDCSSTALDARSRPSASPWASPAVLVRKKDGTLRFCIDYRHLNSVTQTDSHPLPRINDLLETRKVLHKPGFSQWILAGEGAPGISSKDCFCNAPWLRRVQCHVFWFEEYFNGGTERLESRRGSSFCVCIHR